MTNEELIAALESAPTGTRELDARVYIALLMNDDREMRRTLGVDATVEFVEYAHTVERYRRYDVLCTVPHAVVRVTLSTGETITEAWDDIPYITTDLNFRLPGVPEGVWIINVGQQAQCRAELRAIDEFGRSRGNYAAYAHTEALARIIVQLKAALATKGEK